MANYLVANNVASDLVGHDGIVVTSNGQHFFTYVEVNATTLGIFHSTDGGITWSSLINLTISAGHECGMFMDASDSLHVATRDAAGASNFTYRRFDVTDYATAAVTETVTSDVSSSFSPLGIVSTASNGIYVFYEDQVGAGQGTLYYARRTGVNTWSANNIVRQISAGNNLSYDILLSNDSDTIYIAYQAFLVANPLSASGLVVAVRSLVLNTITLLFTLNSDGTNTYNFWLAEVSGVVRLYASLIDGITGSASILFSTAAGGTTTLFTSSRAADALRGISRDATGINIYYGDDTGALYRRTHLLDGTVTDEVTEVAAPTDILYGNSIIQRGGMHVGYPRFTPFFNGGAGIYGQPAGSLRFFSSLVEIASAGGGDDPSDGFSWALSDYGYGELQPLRMGRFNEEFKDLLGFKRKERRRP